RVKVRLNGYCRHHETEVGRYRRNSRRGVGSDRPGDGSNRVRQAGHVGQLRRLVRDRVKEPGSAGYRIRGVELGAVPAVLDEGTGTVVGQVGEYDRHIALLVIGVSLQALPRKNEG